MIKFFRTIRQRLLYESKFSKYLLYATGEIILVVIGILIALQINNWNEDRKLYQTENEFIINVKNDLRKDSTFIQLIIQRAEPRLKAYKQISNDLDTLNLKDRSSLDSFFRTYFTSQRTFYPISGSFESALSGNQINKFRNKELVQELIQLYNATYDRLIDNGDEIDQRWAFLSKKYSHERRTGQLRDMNERQISEFLDDVYHHYIQLEWYTGQLRTTINKISKIIKSMNSSLK